MNRRIRFLEVCYYLGVLADLLATVPLVFPQVARTMFGLQQTVFADDYLYVSRIAASLMLGWTFLLLWGSFKPVERRAILLLTVCPVLLGLVIALVHFGLSGTVEAQYLIPLWIFYALIIPLYIVAYSIAGKSLSKGSSEEGKLIASTPRSAGRDPDRLEN
jgi:hypothetical protein